MDRHELFVKADDNPVFKRYNHDDYTLSRDVTGQAHVIRQRLGAGIQPQEIVRNSERLCE